MRPIYTLKSSRFNIDDVIRYRGLKLLSRKFDAKIYGGSAPIIYSGGRRGAFRAVLKIPIEIHIFNITIYRIYVCVCVWGAKLVG